jgi:hypothetical protein
MEEEDFLLSPGSHNISRNIFSSYFTPKPATNFHRLPEHCRRNGEYEATISLLMEAPANAQITECYVSGGITVELFVTSRLMYNLQIVISSLQST